MGLGSNTANTAEASQQIVSLSLRLELRFEVAGKIRELQLTLISAFLDGMSDYVQYESFIS
jgi:hypothetical protein